MLAGGSYLVWLAIFVWLPTAVIWMVSFELLWRYKITMLHVMVFSLIFSVPWDIFAIRNEIWFFPPESNIGVVIGSLPLEEYLFMVTVGLMVASVTVVAKYKLR